MMLLMVSGTGQHRPPCGVNVAEPSPARVYDYLLGGKDNYAADRNAAEAVLSIWPETRDLAVDNREFLGRAVHHLAARAGIDQFLDLGTGLPTRDNVHQVAQRANTTSRVVYVDNDPIVRSHAQALLVSDGQTAFLTADIRSPPAVLSAPETRKLIDLSRPFAVLMVAVLHFVADDPAGIVAGYVDALPPGGYLALSHLTSEGASDELRSVVDAVYRDTPAPLYFRSREQIEAMFCGLPLEEPGLVDVPLWRPNRYQGLGPMRILGGLARKP
jgi:SAM-dependent methyltransferase